MCWKLPRTFRLRRLALLSVQVAKTLTTIPPSATPTESAAYVLRAEETSNGLVDDQCGNGEECRAVELGAQDLGASEAKRRRTLRGPGGKSDGQQREAERGRIGQHVTGIGVQR